MVVFKLRTNVVGSASTLSANIIDDAIFVFTAKRPLHFRRFRLDNTADADVSGQRGRRKTAELHTSGAKRAKFWRGGGKMVRAGHRLGGGVGG